MVNTHANPASQEQAEGSEARNENLPHPPSLAEVMMEAERNKRETNRLLERIEQNTAHHQRTNVVSLSDFIKFQVSYRYKLRASTERFKYSVNPSLDIRGRPSMP